MRDVDQLHELLQHHGADALRAAFAQGLAEQLFGAEYIAHALSRCGAAAETGRRQQELAAVKPADIDLDRLLKRLHLANARRIWRDLIARAEAEQWSFHHFLAILVAEEIAQRQQTRLGRLSRRAQFPFLKTIEEFDFTYQSTVRLALLGSALSPDFVTEGRSLDPPRQARPRQDPSRRRDRLPRHPERLRCALRHRRRAHRRALGGLPQGPSRRGARALHPSARARRRRGRLPHLRHRRRQHALPRRQRAPHAPRSMIFTTNKPLAAWGRVLHDEDLAQAIVDRVLERGRLLHLDGPSMRTKHLGLDDPAASSRHPRIRWSEYPETTVRITGTHSPTLSTSKFYADAFRK